MIPAIVAAPTAKKIAIGLAVAIATAVILALIVWAAVKLGRGHDDAPTRTAGKDAAAARDTAHAIGTAIAARNHDATANTDLTTKDIRDALDAPAPQPTATPSAAPPALPAAPVDRMRDLLNQSIARANRAAGDAPAGQGTDAD